MKKASVWISFLLVLACAPPPQEAEPAAETPTPPAPVDVTEAYPDPDEEVAQEVRDFLASWVAERAGEDGAYAIPPRGDHEVQGTMADFHTVHQKDADTYSVCLDFKSAEQLYDVAPEGPATDVYAVGLVLGFLMACGLTEPGHSLMVQGMAFRSP